MATQVLGGPVTWEGERDSEGHRAYHVTFRVLSDLSSDGPATVLATSGLPQIGDTWAIGTDIDVWAWCRPDCTIKQIVTGEPNFHWFISFLFSTKPPDPDKSRCQTNPIQDPLLEPQRISGKTVKYTEEAVRDRFGIQLLNSAWEQFRGPQVEFDDNRHSIRIEQNWPILDGETWGPMVNTVNDDWLWGFPPRSVKLSDVTWERKFTGVCSVYWTRTFTFDAFVKIDPGSGLPVSGYDKNLLDEGTKVLNGRWGNKTQIDPATGQPEDQARWYLVNINGLPPNPMNPKHFIQFKGRDGNPTRVILNGQGLPAGVITGPNKYFIALQNVLVQNLSLESTSTWLPLSGKIGPQGNKGANILIDIPIWDGESIFKRGEVVFFLAGASYLACILDTVPGNPPPDTPPNNPKYFTLLGTVPPFTFIGDWDPTVLYNAGNIVRDNRPDGTAAGNRFVQKYDESNMLLLGVPVILGAF